MYECMYVCMRWVQLAMGLHTTTLLYSTLPYSTLALLGSGRYTCAKHRKRWREHMGIYTSVLHSDTPIPRSTYTIVV